MSADPSIVQWLRDLRSAEAIYVSDSHQRIVAWSPAAERLTGHLARDVLGRPCYEVIAGTTSDGRAFCRRNCAVARSARHHQPAATYEVTARRRDGQRVCLESTIVVASDERSTRPYLLHLIRPAHANGGLDAPVTTPAAVASLPALARAGERSTVPPITRSPTPRELEVLRLLAAGHSTVEIAERLGITRLTARNHIGNLQRKLGARSRVEAILHAAHHHLI